MRYGHSSSRIKKKRRKDITMIFVCVSVHIWAHQSIICIYSYVLQGSLCECVCILVFNIQTDRISIPWLHSFPVFLHQPDTNYCCQSHTHPRGQSPVQKCEKKSSIIVPLSLYLSHRQGEHKLTNSNIFTQSYSVAIIVPKIIKIVLFIYRF